MKRFVIGVALVATMLVAGVTQGAVQFLDVNFNGVGSPYAIGGYDPAYNSPPSAASGTILVNTQAAVFTTAASNTETGALWLDTGFNVPSQKATLSFDISVLNATPLTNANSQVMKLDSNPNTAGILFGARMYNRHNGQWAFSVAVVPTSTTGGVFALRNADNTNLTTFGSYTNGDTDTVTVIADYTAGTASAYDDGVLGLSGYALRGGIDPNANFGEMFMYMNGGGAANSLSIDNIAAFDAAVAPVPEPATLIIWSLLGGLGVAITHWRKRAK